jgi:hypothetical protein
MATPYVNPLLALDRLRRGLPKDPNEDPLEEIPESGEGGFIGNVGRGALTGAETIGKVLDAPQEALFRAITGKDPRQIGDRDDEISGRELLRELGVLQKGAPNTWGNFAAGLATDLVADPLNLVGVGVFGKGGAAAAKTGALGRAGEAFTLAAKRGAPIADDLMQRAARGAAKTGRRLQDIPDVDIVGRPFVRPRAASRFGSVDDLVKAADAGVDVPGIDRLRRLDAGARAAPLSYDIGIGPTQAMSLKFNVPGGAVVRDALDSLVAGAKFSRYAGVPFRQFFDESASGAATLEDQVYTAGSNILKSRDEARKTAEATAQIAKLRASSDGDAVFSEEGNRSLGRIIEQPKVYSFEDQVKDSQFLRGNVATGQASPVRQFTDYATEAMEGALRESAEVGLPSQRFRDPNIEGYLPRVVSRSIDELVRRRGPESFKAIQTLTGDMLSRSPETMLPGGRDFLSFELGRDPMLVGSKRMARSDSEAAAHIQKRISAYQSGVAEPATVPQRDAMALAQLLNKLPNVGETAQPIFGQHPTETVRSYLAGRTGAISNRRSQLDVLGSYAEGSLEGTLDDVSVPMDEALRRLDIASDETANGTRQILRDIIARRKATTPDRVNLADYYVPESVLNRLNRVTKSVLDPQQQGEFVKGLRYLQDIWRNSVLTWPSRYVRDLMGGFFSNLIEVGNPLTLVTRGYNFATQLLVGKANAMDGAIMSTIKRMPYYADVPASELGARFYGDLAATGLLSSTKKLDRGVAGLEVAEELPGFGRLLPEVGSLNEMPGFLAGIANPQSKFATAGAKIGDSTDAITRLAGYAELLFQGFSPDEAARRMKRTHVDYSSLSEGEKAIRNYFVPFYTFATRQMLEAGRRVVEEPASLNALLRASQAPAKSQDDDQYVPQFARERVVLGAFPGTDGSQNILYNLDVPTLSALEGLGDPSVQNLGGSLSPAAKLLTEYVTGVDTFTKRPLSETKGNVARMIGAGPGGPVQVVDKLVDGFVPFGSRVSGMARDLIENRDERSTGELYGQTGVNLLTGLKWKNITRDELLDDATRTQEDRLGGLLRTHTSKYVPKEILPFLPESAQRDYRNYRQLNKIRQTRRKRREEEMAQ